MIGYDFLILGDYITQMALDEPRETASVASKSELDKSVKNGILHIRPKVVYTFSISSIRD